MADLKLFNTVTLGAADKVLYDQKANEVIEVYLEDAGEEALSAEPIAGKYSSAGAWELFGPDGEEVFLLGIDNPIGISGSIANPKTFLPPIPGRWLVRFTTNQYVLNDALEVVLAEKQSVFTALYEIQDPNILGHRDARPYGNGAITRGASTIAPNETNEYDIDEGWSRGIERYLQTVSREQGFRSTAVVKNTGGVQIDAGYICCSDAPEALERWKNADVSISDFNNVILKVKLATAADPSLWENPKYIALEDIADGDRGLVLVEGVIPFDTSSFAATGRLYISETGELTTTLPSSVDPALHDYQVGKVGDAGTDDGTNPATFNPGSIYFHGFATLLPGFISGPASSIDHGIAIWDGVYGNKLQSPNVRITESALSATVHGPPSGDLAVKSGEGPGSNLALLSSDSAGGTGSISLRSGGAAVGSSGYVYLDTGDAALASGDLEVSTGNSDMVVSGSVRISTGVGPGAGSVVLQPGKSTDSTGGAVSVRGGESDTTNGGAVSIVGGNTNAAAGRPGDVSIRPGVSTVDSSFGDIFIDHANEINISATHVRTASELSRWLAVDPTGVDVDISKVQLFHDYGVNTKFSFTTEAGTTAVEINTDEHSYFRTKLSIGTDTEPAGAYQFHLEGDGNVLGNFRVDGKLDVTGLIDPTGLILTPIDDITDILGSMAAGEGGIFVAGPGLVASGFTEGDLYYTDPTGGTVSSLTETVEAGAALAGPFSAGSTEVNQVAVWSGADGDGIKGGGLLVTPDGIVKSLRNAAGLANPIIIQPSAHSAAGDQTGAALLLSAGIASGAGIGGSVTINATNSVSDVPGKIALTAGSAEVSSEGGEITLLAGNGGLTAAGYGLGGRTTIGSGHGGLGGGQVEIVAGKSMDNAGKPALGPGGSVIVASGEGGTDSASSGSIELVAASGSSGSVADAYKGGSGGHVFVRAGMGGPVSSGNGGDIFISAGSASALDPAAWGVADAGVPGKVQIKAGDSPNTVVGSAHFKPGANVEIIGGDAGINSSGDGGNIVIEPGAIDPAHPMPWIGHQGIVHLCGSADALGDQKSHVAIGSQVASGFGAAIGDCFGQTAHTIHGFLKITGGFDPTCVYIDPQDNNPVIQYLTDAYAAWEDAYSPERVSQIASAIAQLIAEKAAVEEAKSSALSTLAGLDEPDPALTDEVERLTKQQNTLFGVISKLQADKIKFETPPIDVSSPEGQRFIKHTMWVKKVLDDDGNHLEDRIMVGDEPVGTRGTLEYDSVTVTYMDSVAISDGHLGDGDGPTGKVQYYSVPSTVGVVLVDSTEGDVAVMLPDPALNNRRSIYIKDKAGQSNIPGRGQIYIVPPSGTQLDQYTYSSADSSPGPYPMQPWASRQCYSDGINWFMI